MEGSIGTLGSAPSVLRMSLETERLISPMKTLASVRVETHVVRKTFRPLISCISHRAVCSHVAPKTSVCESTQTGERHGEAPTADVLQSTRASGENEGTVSMASGVTDWLGGQSCLLDPSNSLLRL